MVSSSSSAQVSATSSTSASSAVGLVGLVGLVVLGVGHRTPGDLAAASGPLVEVAVVGRQGATGTGHAGGPAFADRRLHPDLAAQVDQIDHQREVDRPVHAPDQRERGRGRDPRQQRAHQQGEHDPLAEGVAPPGGLGVGLGVVAAATGAVAGRGPFPADLGLVVGAVGLDRVVDLVGSSGASSTSSRAARPVDTQGRSVSRAVGVSSWSRRSGSTLSPSSVGSRPFRRACIRRRGRASTRPAREAPLGRATSCWCRATAGTRISSQSTTKPVKINELGKPPPPPVGAVRAGWAATPAFHPLLTVVSGPARARVRRAGSAPLSP